MKCPLYTFRLIVGTAFYFAVESEDELPLWMDCITLATFKQDFSETGQESEGAVFLSRCLGFASQVFYLCVRFQLVANFPKQGLQ